MNTSSGFGGAERSELIERFTIPLVWRLLGLPGEPAASCKSPLRKDVHPSFSVFEGGRAFKDFATGDAGNVFRFFGLATNTGALDEYAAFKRFLRSKGFSVGADDMRMPIVRAERAPERFDRLLEGKDSAPQKENSLAGILGRFYAPTEAECRQLGLLRRLHPGAFDLAARLGTLRVGSVCDAKSWILTDASAQVAEARRFDGAPYPATASGLGERKTHTLRGSRKDWPVGLVTLRPEVNVNCKRALLVEGSGDYFAALELIALHGPGNILPIAMLGAGAARIHPDALARLKLFKEVLIISHRDRAGAVAGEKWRAALLEAGAKPTLRLLHFGAPGKDLGEILACASETQKTQFAKGYLS